MNEHYVSYEQAVALKRLGFDWKVDRSYTDVIKESAREEWDEEECQWCTVYDYNSYPKPRLDQAAAWMRDCKDTIVIVEPYWECEIEDDSDYLTGKWYFVVWKDGCRILCNFDPNKEDEELWLFDSYEEALGNGISKALELLGKEVKE